MTNWPSLLEPSVSWKVLYPQIEKAVKEALDSLPPGELTSAQLLALVAPGLTKEQTKRWYRGLFATAAHGGFSGYLRVEVETRTIFGKPTEVYAKRWKGQKT